MNVPNKELKAFKDMTPEERSAIVEAKLRGDAQLLGIDGDWHSADSESIDFNYEYRTRPRQLVIPWEVIKPEYKWAAMDESGSLWVYEGKPKAVDSVWGYSGGLDSIGALNIDTTGIDWRESLVQRPE